MPRPSSTSSSSRTGGRALGITLGAVCAVELVLALVGPPSTPPILAGERFYSAVAQPTQAQSVIQWQMTRLATIDPPELVIMGDSSALTGVDPAIVQERTGLRTENLATILTLGIEGQVQMLETLIQTHGPPRMVLFHFSDPTLATDDTGEFVSSDAFDAFEKWTGRAQTPEMLLPSYALRVPARRLVGGQWYASTGRDQYIRSVLEARHGYFPVQRIDGNDPDVHGAQVALDEANVPALQRLFALAAEHRICLVVLYAPIPASYRSATEWLHRQNAARLRELARPWGTYVVVPDPLARYVGDPYFHTYQHLFEDGATQNSVDVAALLGDIDAGRRLR